MSVDPFTETLNRFCNGMSEKIAYLADISDDNEGVRLIAGQLLDAVRETVANLLLLELECERILHRA